MLPFFVHTISEMNLGAGWANSPRNPAAELPSNREFFSNPNVTGGTAAGYSCGEVCTPYLVVKRPRKTWLTRTISKEKHCCHNGVLLALLFTRRIPTCHLCRSRNRSGSVLFGACRSVIVYTVYTYIYIEIIDHHRSSRKSHKTYRTDRLTPGRPRYIFRLL